ncbi:trans-4-hydroxy-L-proline dehydratase activase [Oceanirhabdus sp. W0125-5]|uniref:trans-4-hydroxy-L-proline dehydratase activase n=1 Tax=Oceanirhabdus sp. W0125-5 TaxID=2999116 RepID=UPI0022F3182C|nr:trans-4-hydroxy-L-proline dehydratase activase [Oceanirhabdus sp. W0125-5]WBW95178.1 glycyl-radical enzyme activating protein [Oceanirhabdus sp. W0125-5]
MMRGTVFNIQRYSLHDGPGIRTTVFLKGCPLRCWWCHNPESQSCRHEIMVFKERCQACGICEKKCPEKAISIEDSFIDINNEKCNLCGLCTDLCPNNVFEYVGKDMSVQEIMKEIEKDEIFYEESDGGVTFSGGEPMIQVDFLNEVLRLCKERGFHTAVDVSGYGAWENFKKVADKVDLFLYDLKFIDDEKHKKYIEVSNELIIDNLKKLSEIRANIYVRMPIIKGINDNDEDIDESIKFLSQLNILQVNLLPYHKIGMDKYKRIGMEYKLSGFERPSDEKINEIAMKFNKAGIKVKIGG